MGKVTYTVIFHDCEDDRFMCFLYGLIFGFVDMLHEKFSFFSACMSCFWVGEKVLQGKGNRTCSILNGLLVEEYKLQRVYIEWLDVLIFVI